jgi:hypothetical protein
LAPFGSHSSSESREHTFRDLQLTQLVCQPSPFRVEPGKPFGNPLLLLADLVQCRHIPLSLGSPGIGHNATAPKFVNRVQFAN